MTDEQLDGWLFGPKSGVVEGVLAEPESIVWQGTNRGFHFLKDVEAPTGDVVRLVVQVNQARRSAQVPYKVTSVYPDSGDRVRAVLPDRSSKLVPLGQGRYT